MPPSLTKKTEASTTPLVLPWHPNFRNYERLPDIKVVRTTFFVNAVAITLTVLLAAWVASNEYSLSEIDSQLAESRAQAERLEKPSAAEVARFKKFQLEESRFKEIDEFVKSRHQVSSLLQHIGATLPKGMALNYFDVRVEDRGKVKAAQLILRGVVRGSADVATGRASSYEGQLRQDPQLSSVIESVSLTNATRNPADDRLSFEMQIKLKALSK